MANERSEWIRTVLVDGRESSVFGCWDRETPEGTHDYYEVATASGETLPADTLRLGDPLFTAPDDAAVARYVRAAMMCTECDDPACAGMLCCPKCGTDRHDDVGIVSTVIADHGLCDDCQQAWREGRVGADD